MLTVNAGSGAEVIIPMQCEYYALEGLSALVKTINGIAKYQPATQNRRFITNHVRSP